MRTAKIINRSLAAVAVLYGSVVFAPALLAFPHHARIGHYDVRSDAPIDRAALAGVLSKADRRLASSAIFRQQDRTPLFLTDGGWRWRVLAGPFGGTFAFSRANGVIIVGRHDVARDTAWNGGRIGGSRSLSGTIAHEVTHNLLRQRYGITVDFMVPKALREGYCDHVAGGGSLSETQARALLRAGSEHPALVYYRGRKQVEAALARNGGSVDALFGQP